MDTPPVACTLSGAEHAERVTLIGELNGAHLLRHEREGLTGCRGRGNRPAILPLSRGSIALYCGATS
jgi:hypothetical protein